MLKEDLLQFQLPAKNTSGISQSWPQGVPPCVLGSPVVLGYEEDHGFEEGSLTSNPCSKGRGRGEKTTCQLEAGLDAKILQDIRYPLERGLTL